MKNRPVEQIGAEIEMIARAEAILNRTLAYQAAAVVHRLKEELDLDVEALSLLVAPLSTEAPGTYRVTCTIASLVTTEPLVLDLVIEPDKEIASRKELPQ